MKVTSRELLNSLKDKLVSGWREFDPLRSGVKTAITNVIYPKLPESKYSEVECALLSAGQPGLNIFLVQAWYKVVFVSFH